MFASILVPLDGTPAGEYALTPATQLARRFNATLHLVHVLDMVGDAGPGEPEQVQALLEQREMYLQKIADRRKGVSIQTRVLSGDVAHEVAATVRELDGGLVVLSTHGRTNGARLAHRCVAASITRRVHVPVLMVRHRAPARRLQTVRHVLLPLSGSTAAEEVLDCALQLGKYFGAAFTLLRVAPAVAGKPRSGRGESQAYLERVAERLRNEGADVRVKVVKDQDPARGIRLYVARQARGDRPVDLIAMTTRGLGGLRHMLKPGIGAAVLGSAEVPVLLCHSRSRRRRILSHLVQWTRRWQSWRGGGGRARSPVDTHPARG